MSYSRVLLRTSIFVCACSIFFATLLPAADGLLAPELIELYRDSNVNPFDVSATNNYAMKLVRQGRYDRALKLLRRAQQLAPGRGDIARNAAQLNMLVSQIERLDLNTSLSLNQSFKDSEVPFIPEPWGQDADVDNSVPGTPDSEQGRKVNPFDSQSLVTTASVKLNRGDLRGALRDLLRAKRLSPWMSELDGQIAILESQVSALGLDELGNSGSSYLPDNLDSPEPFDIWSDGQNVSPN